VVDPGSVPRAVDRCTAALATGYAVRPASVADSEDLATVHVQVWRETYAGLMSAEYLAGLDREAFARHWRGVLTTPDPSVRLFVGLAPDGQVVGFAAAGPSRDEGGPAAQELYAINVLASATGTGLAHLLMAAVVDPQPCSLWVAEGNARPEVFYAQYGFSDDGTTMVDPRSEVVKKRMVRPADES
jgi:GNAT superfamily N-acetyltransferase